MNLAPATVLQQGKYRVNGTLGIGGFGITYRAIQTHLNQTVVLKTLNESLRQHPASAQFQQQFIAEAQRLSRCQHSNIVRVIDFFEEAGQSFIAMDYIPGQTLAQIVEADRPLSEAQALHYIRQIASAVSTVHDSGLLHRDIKPENTIRRADSHVVMLIDFGIARDFTAGSEHTQINLLSPGYAPIEQYLCDGKCTPATDIYAIAATLYYLLCGVPPVAAPLRDRIPLTSLRQFVPNLSPGTERAILQGLETDFQKRPQTVENWLTMLQDTEQLPGEKKSKQSLRLPAPPPPALTLLAFVVTAAIAGWMGFDLAWHYNSTSASSNRSTTESFSSLEDLLKSRDLSGPMFGRPSVESSPLYPIELNKRPKPTPDSSDIPEPIDPSTASVQPSPFPTPETPPPEAEAEPLAPPEPEPEASPSEIPIPEPQTPIEPAPQPAPAPIPEVAPLPPEPPSYWPPAPAPPAVPSAGTFSPSESAPPAPAPPIPSPSGSSSDSSIDPYSPPPVPETALPFPEPATN
ncbi:serine/threonine-protein kinase [Tychonema sp. LEGE 07203]|uniref:serine/threonine protein kinase n=1 Tax=Tychonema sp. LEGE 07203 TaxID=1828671 RepID=UPI001880EF3B|nr:serine/threonine-protein kinase [Tychonema sp. LEGE 07203]MBE9097280.1 serine/threonine protein kinase [Tychonema sp. LEGE 07203]